MDKMDKMEHVTRWYEKDLVRVMRGLRVAMVGEAGVDQK